MSRYVEGTPTPLHDAMCHFMQAALADPKSRLIRHLLGFDATDYEILINTARISWEVPVTSPRRDYIVGFIDLVVEVPVWDAGYWSEQRIFLEIKPNIPSVGELLRQINKYRHFLHISNFASEIGKWVVVSDEGSLRNPIGIASILASQDVALFLPNLAELEDQLALDEREASIHRGIKEARTIGDWDRVNALETELSIGRLEAEP
ncbi:MAG: hypothetical protein J2P41_22715 [Blastocatellia bacterium]|nr:hypothetical protein [Blastocatellia bacterium]